MLGLVVVEPLGNGGYTSHLHLHQLKGRVGKLLLSRDEEAAVGPQQGLLLGDKHGGHFATETAEPFYLLPVVGEVFALVRIVVFHYIQIDALLLHELTKLINS